MTYVVPPLDQVNFDLVPYAVPAEVVFELVAQAAAVSRRAADPRDTWRRREPADIGDAVAIGRSAGQLAALLALNE